MTLTMTRVLGTNQIYFRRPTEPININRAAHGDNGELAPQSAHSSHRFHLTDAPHLLTVDEARQALRISRWTLYRLIQQRQLTTVKIGSRRLVPRESLEALIARLVDEAVN
jgi:excisionase family DNA binding protein